VSPQAEEEPLAAVEKRAPATPPPPAPATTVEEGEAVTEVTVTQVALEAPSKAGPIVECVVTVLDEDLAPPPPSVCRDAAMAPALELAHVPVMVSLLLAVEVSVPSLEVGAQGPLQTAEVEESCSV
jgi:hypothetical protein